VDWEREHLTNALIFELSHVDDQGVKDKLVSDILNPIDRDLAVKVAFAVGAQIPSRVIHTNVGTVKRSPSLSQTYYQSNTIETRRVAFLLAKGFDGHQVEFLGNYIVRAGAVPVYLGPHQGTIRADNTYSVNANATFNTTRSVLFDAVIIVGGLDSINTLEDCGETAAFVREAFVHGKPIMAVGEGVDFVERLSLPQIDLASDDSPLKISKGVVSSRSCSDPEQFADAMYDAIAAHRHFNRNVKKVPI